MPHTLQDSDGVIVDSDGVPVSIRIFKPGSNLDVRGMDAVYDPKDAARIMKANNRSDGKVPFDIAHGATSGGNSNPEMHESVAWGDLRCDKSGIWLDDIEWSPSMRAKLLDKRFRYYSPTFLVDQDELKRTKGKKARITDIMTCALTNIPATLDIDPIVEGRECVRRSLLSVSVAEKALNRLPTDMAKRNSDSAEALKREDEDESKDGEKPTEDKEPIVRDEDEDEGKDGGADGTGHDEPDGDEGYDLDNVDVDSMDEAEVKKLCMHLLDKVADLKKASMSREEEEDEDEEGEKRSIVNQLHADRLIDFRDKKDLLALPLKKLVQQERSLRRDPKAAKAQAKDTARMAKREPAHTNVIVGAFDRANGPQRGATDAEIAAFWAERGTDPIVADRLGLNEQVRGKQWGMTVPTPKTSTKKAG
jgi:phage I-like protein